MYHVSSLLYVRSKSFIQSLLGPCDSLPSFPPPQDLQILIGSRIPRGVPWCRSPFAGGCELFLERSVVYNIHFCMDPVVVSWNLWLCISDVGSCFAKW